MSSDGEKAQRQITRLRAKLASAFRQTQTLHDMIKNLDDKKVQTQFLIGCRALDRQRYETVLDEIMDLELAHNPEYKPNYEPLLSYDTLYASIQIAQDKLSLTAVKPSSSKVEEQSSRVPDLYKFATNLPPITIKPFSGEIPDWVRFRDLFTSIIINNNRLSNIEKLHYLISSVSDRALEIISNFPLSDINFEPAWKALKDRYDSDRILAAHYFEKLVKINHVPLKPSLESLQSFLTKVHDNITGLKNMNLPDLTDFLIFNLSIKQLDPVTRKEFESKHKDQCFPSYESLITFVKDECRLLEITNAISRSETCTSDKHIKIKSCNYKSFQPRKPSVFTTLQAPHPEHCTTPHNNQNRIVCLLCHQPHHLFHCPRFIALSVTDRHSFVKKNHLCYNCLGTHLLQKCRSTRNCNVCLSRHHRLLHFNNSNCEPATSIKKIPSLSLSTNITSAATSSSAVSNINSSCNPTCNPSVVSGSPTLTTLTPASSANSKNNILLGTAIGLIKDITGRFVKFRVLLDCASTATFITKNLTDRLGLHLEPYTQEFYGLSAAPVASCTGIVNCDFKPVGSYKPPITVRALVIDHIVQDLPSIEITPDLKQSFSFLHLADPYLHCTRPVDVLLGADILPDILTSGNSPFCHPNIGILNTVFGHVIFGQLHTGTSSPPINHQYSLTTYPRQATLDGDAYIHKQVERFWEVENFTSSSPKDPSEEYCEKHFLETYQRDSTGRYIVCLPFKTDASKLEFPQSRDVAIQRFYSLENRFRKNPELKRLCVDFLKEYQALGHMIKSTRPGKYFIPYFCVFNPLSPTTPTRVVFDGSAKRSHIALNEMLLPGPKLQNDIPDVLLNFRLKIWTFTCDISKMYRQIRVQDSQCNFQHILFREDPSQPLTEFELLTVTYGLSPSSFLSHRTLIQLTRDEGQSYPLAVDAILNESCVDDILTGADSLTALIDLKEQLCNLLSKGGFSLNKWSSNSPDFIDLIKNSCSQTPLVIRNTDDHSIKVLGLGWNPKLDCFIFMIDSPPVKSFYTKREVLSAIAKIYDPLGFVSPTIFHFKCILKEIWLSGVGWDDPLPPHLTTQWQHNIAELPVLQEIQIPRCIFPQDKKDIRLLGFCDGSMKGSAAAVYLRIEYSDGSVRVFLVRSKTRVAPTKLQTIPRLELLGAVLLSQVLISLKSFLNKISISEHNIFLFTDSTIVLSWLRKPPHLLKLFVANRISFILEHTSANQWHHITTDMNISDVASRGLTPLQLVNNKEWFEGPSWVYHPPPFWNIKQFDPPPEHDLPELKMTVLLSNTAENFELPPPWLYKYSSLLKLQRVVGYVLRFLNNVRFNHCRKFGPLTVLEMNAALTVCLRCDQKYYFRKDIENILSSKFCSPKIQSLSPFVDQNYILRVGGRLKNSELPFNEKHPILLSNKSPLSRTIIDYFHRFYLHSGPRTLSALIARKYWIISSRNLIRQIIRKCITCSRFRATTASPIMADLPSTRVTCSRPFQNCGVDLAGPYILKESLRRNARTYKGYFAIFVCFAIKAVHIEALTSLSTDCFIAALQRFVSRRGLPHSIYCDQATNFKGASKSIKEIVSFLRAENTGPILEEHFASLNINFLLNVPHAPFMNGLAESNIKNIKTHMLRVIGQQVLTLEEFNTILTRIEAILNSRPLCALSTSPDDFQSLTPAHFLIGNSLMAVPEIDLADVSLNRLSRWQLVSQITQSLWRRWEREYLHTLQNKGKWFRSNSNLDIGQLVWIKEDRTHPLMYPLGRIIGVHPGQDGVTRAARVRTTSGTYLRPTRKLAPLPVQ